MNDIRKKACSKCGETKSLVHYYSRADGRLLPECKICFNKRTNKRKRLAASEAVPEGLDPTVNAFHWRTFVQPHMPAKEKWGQQPRPNQKLNTAFTQYP